MNTSSDAFLGREQDVRDRAFTMILALNILVSTEVPLLGRSVDLVYFHNDQVVTFEFKLKDWRQALKQARDHLLGADLCYICMPKRKFPVEFLADLDTHGIGLVAFTLGPEGFEVVREPRRSNETWAIARTRIIEYLYQDYEQQRVLRIGEALGSVQHGRGTKVPPWGIPFDV